MSTEGCNIPAQAARLAPTLRSLAERGVFFGTSSWKYDGWLGSIYSQDRYMTRGKFSNAKFEQDCLAEYAETFPTVCGDLTFFQLELGVTNPGPPVATFPIISRQVA